MNELMDCLRKHMRAGNKMAVDTMKKYCPDISTEKADQLVASGFLRKIISFRDPNEGVELASCEAPSLELFLKGKPRRRNSDTGTEYGADEMIQVSQYQITNAVYLFEGLTPLQDKKLQDAIIVGCDIVSFSEGLTDKQFKQFEMLRDVIASSLNTAQLKPVDCFAISTGDGYFVVFAGPSAIDVFRFIDLCFGDIVKEGKDLPLRFGVHAGPIYSFRVDKGARNAIGHALNITARIMGFGDRNHILVTKEFFDLKIKGTSIQNNFRETGARGSDKHLHEYDIFNYTHGDIGNPDVPKRLKK